MNPQTIAFQGELQLLRWSKTSNSGATITLALSDPADLAIFEVMTLKKGSQAGQRLMCVMVEIGDDELPVVQDVAPVAKLKGGPLAKLAGQYCSNPKFWDFCNKRIQGADAVDSEEEAASLVRYLCNIQGRAELDHNAHAAELFHRTFRIPFINWVACQ